MNRSAKAPRLAERVRVDGPFWALSALVVAAFLFGGGARDDLLSLLILRPLSALALVYGLYGLRLDDVRAFRTPLLFTAALLLLIAAHLVPLPPSIWSALPGRDIVVEAGNVAGIQQPWRPIALVPWRGWNALYAMLLPAAALVLAIRCNPEGRRAILPVVLACGLTSVIFAMIQAVSGYRDAFYLYAITNEGSPTGLFANRNHQAAMICALLPLLAAFAGTARRADFKRIYPWLASAAGGVMLLVLLITGSRAGLLLSLVALTFVALVYRPTNDKSGRRLLWLVLLGVGALLIALVAATFLSIGGLERLLNIDSAEEGRLQSWPIIANLVKTYFPVGSGIGSFVEVYMVAEPRELLGPEYLNHAHNDYLEWSLEGGLPAIALILTAIVTWLRNFAYLVGIRRQQGRGALALAGAGVILILGLASAVDYPLRVPSLAVTVAIACIWMVAPRVSHAGGAVQASDVPKDHAGARRAHDMQS